MINNNYRLINENLEVKNKKPYKQKNMHKVFFDTIIVTAQDWGYNYILLKRNTWYISRLNDKYMKSFKYIAFYRTSPICAITCYAKVKNITYNWIERHYDIHLKSRPIMIKPIKLDKDKRHLAPQSTKYVKFSKFKKARKISDL